MNFKIVAGALRLVKSGTLEVRSNHKKSVVITVQKNTMDLNFLDPSPFRSRKKMGIIDAIEEARDPAKQLAAKNLTLSISRRDKTVLKIGKDAKPKFSRLVTRSKAIQVVNLAALRKLDKEFSG